MDLPTTTPAMDLPPTPVEAARSNEKAKQAISVVFVKCQENPLILTSTYRIIYNLLLLDVTTDI